jgi:hypothetical protein
MSSKKTQRKYKRKTHKRNKKINGGDKENTSNSVSNDTAENIIKDNTIENKEDKSIESNQPIEEGLQDKSSESNEHTEEVVEDKSSELNEPTEEIVEEEKKKLKAVFDNIPYAKEIIDKNPIAGHAISLLQNVFPKTAGRLSSFLEKNKESINGIIDEMNKLPYNQQAQLFSEKIKNMPGISENDKKLLKKGISSEAIMTNVNEMKNNIEATLEKTSTSLSDNNSSDFPGNPEVIKNNGKTTVIFNFSGGKKKSKKTKKNTSKKSKKTKRRTSKK